MALEKLGLQNADNALSALAHMPPDVAAKMLKTKQGLNVLVHVADKVAPFLLEKMTRAGESAGKALLTLAPRLASSVMKVVPAIGAYPAAKDAVRLNTIAMTGSFTDEKGVTTAYPNREVRALALLGPTTNGADALLAMVEGAGIGNVALPLQLGLAAGSLTLDLMVEYYKDHPEEMSPQFKGAIKAATMMASFVNPQAVTFANETLWGNLTAYILVADTADAYTKSALDQGIADLNYGTICVNMFAGLAYVFMAAPWGAFPGNTMYDIQSGNGSVNNLFMFEKLQKSVYRAPFKKQPDNTTHTPSYVASTKAIARLFGKPTWLNFIRLILASMKK